MLKLLYQRIAKQFFLEELTKQQKKRPKILRYKTSRWDDLLEKFIIETKEIQVK